MRMVELDAFDFVVELRLGLAWFIAEQLSFES